MGPHKNLWVGTQGFGLESGTNRLLLSPSSLPQMGISRPWCHVTKKAAGKGMGRYRIWTKYRVAEIAQKARHQANYRVLATHRFL